MSDIVGRWVSIGPTRITSGLGAVGRLSAIAIHPTSPSIIYVGGRACGVWKTTDGGSSWQPVADSLPTLKIAALAIDPSAPSHVYIATSDFGIFRSEDAGTTWALIPASPNAEVRWGVLLVHPTNPNVFYLTSINGIHRSGDAGASWPLSKAAPPITNENGARIGRATDLMMHPSNPNILYAGIAGDGIYKTVDGGVGGWVKLTAGLPGDFSQVTAITLALARNQPATLYAALSGPAGFPRFSLYRTTNAGSNWSQRFMYDSSDNPPFNDYIGVHPTNTDIVYITGRFFYRSEDGGLNFDREDEPKRPHDDHHAFAQHPIDPKIIYTASDGGIYRSSDTGKSGSWSFIGEGIANVEFFDIADAATEPNLLIGGTQDNAVVHYNGTSTIWILMNAGLAIGDEGAVDFDPTSAQRFYAVAEGINDFYRWYGSGPWILTGSRLPTGCDASPEFGPQTNHFQVHPTIPSMLLATCRSLWRTTIPNYPNPPSSWAGSWSTIFTPLAGAGNVVRLAVDPTVNLYYAGTDRGDLYTGPAGVFSPTPVVTLRRRIIDIEVDLDDAAIVYVALDGTRGDRVYRLRRSSLNPITITKVDITSDLPEGLSLQTIAVDRMAPLTIYVGTNQGIYRGRSTNGGTIWSWASFSNGLPLAVDVRDLEVHPTTGVMRAATFGRGAFEVNTDFPIGSIITAEGKATLLRVHEVGTKFGPPTDAIDVEVVIKLDSEPNKAFGFQLRNDVNENAHRSMLDLLRDAFNRDGRVRIEYVRTGLHNGLILRVEDIR